MQFLSLSHIKAKFKQCGSVFDAGNNSDLSYDGLLHDSFVTIETMTPFAYKRGGVGLVIYYDYAVTPFGQIIVASTTLGVCYLAFEECADNA